MGKKRRPQGFGRDNKYTVEGIKKQLGSEYKDSALQRALDKEMRRRHGDVTGAANRAATKARRRKGK